MAQKDYVNYGRKATRGKTSHRKKQRGSGISRIFIVLATVLVLFFIGSFWFIADKKSWIHPSLVTTFDSKTPGGLPPKPEERWRYIKELENRQTGVQTPAEPFTANNLNAHTQLTNEQRQLLTQMQLDMRQQLTPEIPRPDPVPQTALIPSARNNAPTTITPEKTSTPTIFSTPVVKPKQESNPYWILQCGVFHTRDQAEAVRAQLAFAGIESRITTNHGQNRIVLGPYHQRSFVDKMLQQLTHLSISNCTPSLTGT